jgi:uncharacterized membrane protein
VRTERIELSTTGWKPVTLPLRHARIMLHIYQTCELCKSPLTRSISRRSVATYLVPSTGFEPVTLPLPRVRSTSRAIRACESGVAGRIRTGGFTDLQSVALGHSATATLNGAPGEIRTPDSLLTRQVLWPTELQGQNWHRCKDSNPDERFWRPSCYR